MIGFEDLLGSTGAELSMQALPQRRTFAVRCLPWQTIGSVRSATRKNSAATVINTAVCARDRTIHGSAPMASTTAATAARCAGTSLAEICDRSIGPSGDRATGTLGDLVIG